MDENEAKQACGACGGEGRVPKAQDAIPAPLPPPVEYETCPKCGGTGELPVSVDAGAAQR
jgi:DnaJ-class molecular chaperone